MSTLNIASRFKTNVNDFRCIQLSSHFESSKKHNSIFRNTITLWNMLDVKCNIEFSLNLMRKHKHFEKHVEFSISSRRLSRELSMCRSLFSSFFQLSFTINLCNSKISHSMCHKNHDIKTDENVFKTRTWKTYKKLCTTWIWIMMCMLIRKQLSWFNLRNIIIHTDSFMR